MNLAGETHVPPGGSSKFFQTVSYSKFAVCMYLESMWFSFEYSVRHVALYKGIVLLTLSWPLYDNGLRHERVNVILTWFCVLRKIRKINMRGAFDFTKNTKCASHFSNLKLRCANFFTWDLRLWKWSCPTGTFPV